MLIEIPLTQLPAKAAVAALTVICCGLLALAVGSGFIIGALTDERAAAEAETLAVATTYFPYSARLHARLAEALERDNELPAAEAQAQLASRLSPYDFNFKIRLASLEESNGKAALAEQSLREGLALAPYKADAHWQLANLLLRAGKLDGARSEFRAACAINKQLLPLSLNLVWRATGENLGAIENVAGQEPQPRLALAQFLLKQGRADEAAQIFDRLDRRSRLELPESGAFLRGLMGSEQPALARASWLKAVSGDAGDDPLIWNGGFEADAVKGFTQFDWAIGQSDYARFRIVSGGEAHNGERALRIDFSGRDTTRIEGEVKQALVVRPGARYMLECYAKAQKLMTSEGVRIVVTSASSRDWRATSPPVVAEQQGWQALAVEFVAPENATKAQTMLYVTVSRRPKFSYDEPTRGTVWFDDFTLREVK